MTKRLRSRKAAQRAQAIEATGADEFRMELRISMSAAVAATFVRTTQPFEAMEAIEDMCVLDRLPLRVWNIVRGWQKVDTQDSALPVTEVDESSADPIPALVKLYDIMNPRPGQQSSAASQSAFPKDCVAVMMWPDYYIKNIPQMRAVLAEVVRELQVYSQRLVLIVPPSFSVPDELAEIVPIIDFGLPTQTEMLAIYNKIRTEITTGQRELTKEFDDEDALMICKAGAGMTRGEFTTAISKAWVSMERRKQRGIDVFVQSVMETKVSVVKRSEVLEVLKPVPVEEIGGLGYLKQWVQKRRKCFSEEAMLAGVDMPRGIALIGPPGTGKSAVSKCISSVLQVPCIRFDISRVFGSLVGESEARMHKALQMIDAMAPCVAFVDEIDKVFNINSGGGDSGTSTRVLGKILTHMQESKKPIFWVLTANRTDNLPPELLRKGRVDEIFSVTTPTEEERREILYIHLRMRGEDPDEIDGIDRAVEACAGYVGGEIEQAVKDAKIEAFDADEDLTGQHLVDAIRAMKPLSKTFEEDFAAMESWAEQHARPASADKRVGAAPGRTRRPRAVSSARATQRNTDDELAG